MRHSAAFAPGGSVWGSDRWRPVTIDRMAVDFDDVHACPVCGSAWKIPVEFTDDTNWYVPADTEWCSNPACPMTDEQRDAYRHDRRVQRWDPDPRSE